MARRTRQPRWAERKVTSVYLSLAARDRLQQMSKELKLPRGAIVDLLVRAFSFDEVEAACRRVQAADGHAAAAWERGEV